MQTKKHVKLQIASHPPLDLTWEQFTDLANCCHDLAEFSQRVEMRFGSVTITMLEKMTNGR